MASLALVADYAGDDSSCDSSEELDETNNIEKAEGNGGNFFSIENDLDDDSESDPDEQSRCGQQDERLPNPLFDKLPSPSLSTGTGPASVFSNPFQLAEQSRHSILEQHVKMTETKLSKTGKKVCFKFKRGKCRMGKNCRFSHDADTVIVKSDEPVGEGSTGKRKKKVGISNNLVPPKRAMMALEMQREKERPWTVPK
ncbi:hypothetical protein ScPMuIL_006032 [Solemya velum]